MTQALSGLELSRLFYVAAVRPILDQHFPNLPHTAARIGHGSEILGYDDAMSIDHDWGARLQIFVSKDDYLAHSADIRDVLSAELPSTIHGYSTNFSPPAPNDNGTQSIEPAKSERINHRVEFHTLRSFVHSHLNFDINESLTETDWLTFSQQHLLGLTAGSVFHDDVGLAKVRARFAYYPDDVWFYMLAASWGRINQEEHLMGRAGFVGDEIGSALIAARLVRDVMNLCFLMARRYAPYPKWFGTAFRELEGAATLEPVLKRVLSAETWQQREQHLVTAYEHLAQMHNALNITPPLATKTTPFFTRPFQVITTNGIIPALLAKINDPNLREHPLMGNIDQLSDNTDLVSHTRWRPILKQLYI